MSDDEEFETVIYNGPGKPYFIVSDSEQPTHKNVKKDTELDPIGVRLAQTSAHYGGLLSPDFFTRKPGSSISDSSRDDKVIPHPNSSTKLPSTLNLQKMNIPFAFPKVALQEVKSSTTLSENITKLERVEILDEDTDEINESEWMDWPKTYIEQKGFRLGIRPGVFYRNRSRPCFYVKLPHRSGYEILATNSNPVACDLDLYVNGQQTNAIRLPAGATMTLDGPIYSKHAFKIFRSKDAPEGLKVKEGARENGMVKAVFTPKKVGGSRLRAISEPLRFAASPVSNFWDILDDPQEKRKPRSHTTNDGDGVERSLDMSQVVEGVTLLQGIKKKKHYAPATDMEVDLSQRVVLQLRLIASLVEEVEDTEQQVYDLEPPPLPSRRD